MTTYKTNREIAENFELWQEYFDTDGHTSREDFDAISVEEKERMIEEVNGTDDEQRSRLGIA